MGNPFSKESKKFSIGVPIYGITANDLPKFFSAMNEQEYKNYEVVVTFDGPHRKGVNIIKKEIKKYPKMDIKYQTIEHAGCTSARNACVDLFTGDYYVFTAGDCYLYPEALRIWANAFEEDSEAVRVWGMYDIVNENGETLHPVGQVPLLNGKVWYGAFKYSPYCDATFPIRKDYFAPWDPDCKSLNDWEWSVRQLSKDNFSGKGWVYIPHHFFAAEAPRPGGLSHDSHDNWETRKKYIQDKNEVKEGDICVVSLGAPNHGIPVSEILGAEYLTMPSYKKHHYKAIYLLGFYTREDPQNPYVTRTHMDVFRNNEGKNIIHWIGTDILDLRWHCSFEKIKALKKWFKENNIIHLCEADFTQKELAEVGIKAKILPIPPKTLYDPMPLPDDFTVGVYLPGRDIYKEELIHEVARSMPDVKFYFFGDDSRKGQKADNWEHLGFIDFDEWMPKMSCNLRITLHDGLPLTPIQFLTAGRNVVCNLPLKGAIEVKQDRAEIVKALRKAQKTPLKANVAQHIKSELNHDKFVKRIRGLV